MNKERLLEILADRKLSCKTFGGFTSSKNLSKALKWMELELGKLDTYKQNLEEAITLLKEMKVDEDNSKLQKLADKYTEEELLAVLELKKQAAN